MHSPDHSPRGDHTMSARACLLLAGLLVYSPTAVRAQVSQVPDAVAASPDNYTVLLENEHVRVVEYRIEPGAREAWHTHPAKVMYILGGGTLKVTAEGGESQISTSESGAVRWSEAAGPHYGENVGQTTIRILLVEVKAASSPAGAS